MAAPLLNPRARTRKPAGPNFAAFVWPFLEDSQRRAPLQAGIILLRANRRSPESADRFVKDPKADAVSSNRS